MKYLLNKLARVGRVITRWYDKNIRVPPGSLVWPEPPSARPARARAKTDQRR